MLIDRHFHSITTVKISKRSLGQKEQSCSSVKWQSRHYQWKLKYWTYFAFTGAFYQEHFVLIKRSRQQSAPISTSAITYDALILLSQGKYLKWKMLPVFLDFCIISELLLVFQEMLTQPDRGIFLMCDLRASWLPWGWPFTSCLERYP